MIFNHYAETISHNYVRGFAVSFKFNARSGFEPTSLSTVELKSTP